MIERILTVTALKMSQQLLHKRFSRSWVHILDEVKADFISRLLRKSTIQLISLVGLIDK